MRLGDTGHHPHYDSIDHCNLAVEADESKRPEGGRTSDREESHTSFDSNRNSGSRATKGIAFILLSIFVASVGTVYFANGNINTAAAEHVKGGEGYGLQPITGIGKHEQQEPYLVEVPNSTTKTLVNEAGSITAYALGVSSAVVSASKEPSDKDLIDKGQEALTEIKDIIDGFPDRDDPAEIMNILAEFSGVVGVFLPQFATIGAAFGVVGSLIGAPEEDPTLLLWKDMNKQFDQVHMKLDHLINMVEGLKMDLCKNSWDDDIKEFVVDHQLWFDILAARSESEAAKSNAVATLRKRCLLFPPLTLLIRFEYDFLGKSMSRCFDEAQKDAANRILYFRRTYTTPFLNYIARAVEFQGLCQGLEGGLLQRAQYNEAKRIINNMTKTFKAAEQSMYDSHPETWGHTIESKYTDCNRGDRRCCKKGDAGCVWNILKKDFFPWYKYATVNVSAYDSSFDMMTFTGGTNKCNGFVWLMKIGVYVWFRNSFWHSTLPELKYMWKNLVCTGRSMCFTHQKGWYGRIVCKQHECNSAWHIARENFKWNNAAAHDEFGRRGAMIIKESQKRTVCPTGQCYTGFDPHWDRSHGVVIGDTHIVETFTTGWLEEFNDYSANFTIMGISGSFEKA